MTKRNGLYRVNSVSGCLRGFLSSLIETTKSERKAIIKMMKKSAIVMGRAGIDLYADPPGTRFEEAGSFMAALGGSSGNIAAGLARQGTRAAMLTCLSDDPLGSYCLRELNRYGVETAHVRRLPGEARTSLAFAETRGDDTRSVLYRNNAVDFLFSDDDVAGVDFSAYGATVATGTALARNPSRSAVLTAFRAARAAGSLTVLDLDYRPYSWESVAEAAGAYREAIAHVDIVIGNDDEFDVLVENSGDGRAEARRIGQNRLVIYKMGAKGAYVFSPTEEAGAGIFRVDALKPTGAGDSFLAGFLSRYLEGAPVLDAVRNGAASAAIVVSRVGCAPAMPTPEEIAAFIADHPGQDPEPTE
jgi:5-dehydro-2-deoxygluconokinase